jgi:hypothetical protein
LALPENARSQDKKRASPERPALISFRRGCLKGPSYVQRSAFFRNCEGRNRRCRYCNFITARAMER